MLFISKEMPFISKELPFIREEMPVIRKDLSDSVRNADYAARKSGTLLLDFFDKNPEIVSTRIGSGQEKRFR